MTHPPGPQAPERLFTSAGPDGHKRQAELLRSYLAHHRVEIGHGHALEAVAARHGLPSWRTLISRATTPPLPGEAAERALRRRLADLGYPPSEALARGAAALLRNPAAWLFSPFRVRFFRMSDGAGPESRGLVVQFSDHEAMQVPDDARETLSQAAVENARAAQHLKVPSLGLFVDGVPLLPPGAVTLVTGRGEVSRHASGLFVLRDEVLSPWPLLPMPQRVGGDVLKRLDEGHTLTWAGGGALQVDGTDLLSDLGKAVPEWVDTDGTRVAAWREHLERALPGTSHYVVIHSLPDRAVRVSMRRGLREVPDIDPMTQPVVVLDDRHPMTQPVAVALAQEEARVRPVYLAAHPALVGSAGARLAGAATLAPGGGQALLDLAHHLRPRDLLVVYLDGPEAEAAALTAAGRGAFVVAVTGHGGRHWERRLEAERQRYVLGTWSEVDTSVPLPDQAGGREG